jgi:hypothetical protein
MEEPGNWSTMCRYRVDHNNVIERLAASAGSGIACWLALCMWSREAHSIVAAVNVNVNAEVAF